MCAFKIEIMKTIYTKFDKKAISGLPRVTFQGDIIVVTKAEETNRAVDYLLAQDILGVDTETRPSFTKGKRYDVSLLQVSTQDTCFLFRLHMTGMTPAIIRLLEDRTVPKVGLSWHDDLLQLHRRAKFKPGYFIELQDVAAKFGIEDKSLQKLYANLFRYKISKTQRLSNWEARELRDPQQVYAATDAWCCIQLYEEFLYLSDSHDYHLEVVVDEETKKVADNVSEQIVD